MAVKSREYEDRIKSMGFERATRTMMMELIEQHNVLEKTLVEFALGFEQMQRILEGVVGMGTQLKEAHAMVISKLGLKGDLDDAPLPNDDRE
jgi:hypothetical protein